jgi:CheY-like chemotaxis protein
MRKLLYIEDNEDNLYMLQLRFDVLGGYEVLSARDGAAGIAMATSERPDLILMDLNLPEIDGWEAARRLNADPATRDIPIIALSAHALIGKRETALAPGCDDFDTKPYQIRSPAGQDRAGPGPHRLRHASARGCTGVGAGRSGASPSHGDVPGLGRFDGTLRLRGPAGSARR